MSVRNTSVADAVERACSHIPNSGWSAVEPADDGWKITVAMGSYPNTNVYLTVDYSFHIVRAWFDEDAEIASCVEDDGYEPSVAGGWDCDSHLRICRESVADIREAIQAELDKIEG